MTKQSSQSVRSKESRLLSGAERGLLEELFVAMPDAEEKNGVDSVRFRALHRHHLDLIERLRSEHLLREEQERFFVPLPAIALLGTEASERWLKHAALVFQGLEEAYTTDPRTPIFVSDLAKRICVPEQEVRQILSYFARLTTWLAFPPNDVLSNPQAKVGASDVVIRHKDFWSAIAQLEEWRPQSPFQMTRDEFEEALRDTYALPTEPSAGGSLKPYSPPSWIAKLPSDLGQVMAEVYAALNQGLRVLPAIGVRTALDLYFAEALGDDHGSFQQKVFELESTGALSARDAEQVRVVINGGNASAHRGFAPDDEDLQVILAVGERLLRAHYDLPASVKRLEANVPARAPKPTKIPKSP